MSNIERKYHYSVIVIVVVVHALDSKNEIYATLAHR